MRQSDRLALRRALNQPDRPATSAILAIIAWCAVWGLLGIIWMMGG